MPSNPCLYRQPVQAAGSRWQPFRPQVGARWPGSMGERGPPPREASTRTAATTTAPPAHSTGPAGARLPPVGPTLVVTLLGRRRAIPGPDFRVAHFRLPGEDVNCRPLRRCMCCARSVWLSASSAAMRCVARGSERRSSAGEHGRSLALRSSSLLTCGPSGKAPVGPGAVRGALLGPCDGTSTRR